MNRRAFLAAVFGSATAHALPLKSAPLAGICRTGVGKSVAARMIIEHLGVPTFDTIPLTFGYGNQQVATQNWPRNQHRHDQGFF